MNGLSGPADVEWEPSLMAESPVWGALWLNFLTRELPGTGINNTATPPRRTSHTDKSRLSRCWFRGGKASAVTAIFHVLPCNCLARVIKTIEQCPQVTSEEKLVSNLRKQECSHQHTTFKMVSNKGFVGGRKNSWRFFINVHMNIFVYKCVHILAKTVTVQCLHRNSYQDFHQMSIDQCPPSLWQHSINGFLIIIAIKLLNLFNDALLEVKCYCFIDCSQLRRVRSGRMWPKRSVWRRKQGWVCNRPNAKFNQQSVQDTTVCKTQYMQGSMFCSIHCELHIVWIYCKFCSKYIHPLFWTFFILPISVIFPHIYLLKWSF